MHIPIIRNFSLLDHVISEELSKGKYEIKSNEDPEKKFCDKSKFLQFTPTKNISKDQIKGVVIKTFKKLEQSEPGFYETLQKPTSYFIPVSTQDDSIIRIEIIGDTYITEEAKKTEMNEIRTNCEKMETKALNKIFMYLRAEMEEKHSLRGSFKNLIFSLKFHGKFYDEYITGKTITRLRSDKDVENIYIEIIDAILNESNITECLPNIIKDCKTISRVYGHLKLSYRKIKKITLTDWHTHFYDAFRVALQDEESCREIKESLKNFDIVSDPSNRKQKINGMKLAKVIEKKLISILNINDTNSLKFVSQKNINKTLGFQEELKQIVELCIWHLQIQCSHFFNILKSFQKICKSVQVEIPNIVNYENTEKQAFKNKFEYYIEKISTCGSLIHDDRYINSLKTYLLERKTNHRGPSQQLYDKLVDPSVFLQFIILLGPSSSTNYLHSKYYVFEKGDTLVPFRQNNTFMVYDSMTELRKLETKIDLELGNETEKGNIKSRQYSFYDSSIFFRISRTLISN